MRIYQINSYSDSSIKQTQSYSKQSQPNFRSKYDDGPAIMATCAAVGVIGFLLTAIQTFRNDSQKSVEPQQQLIITQDSLPHDSLAKTADFKVEQAAQKNTDNDISVDSLSTVSEDSLKTSAKNTIERISYNTSLPEPGEMKPIMKKFFDSVGFPYRKIEINENGDIEINPSRIAMFNRTLDKFDKTKLYSYIAAPDRADLSLTYIYAHQRKDGLIDMGCGYKKHEGGILGRDVFYESYKIYDPKYKKYYTNEYQIFDNYRKRVNVNLNSIDYFKDFNKYMLSSILANYGIFDITDFQLRDNKAVMTCKSIHNTTYKIEFSRKNNELNGLITDNKSKKMLAFIYNDETSGENNIVNLSTQEITNPDYKIMQIAPENMTNFYNYVINNKFYGDEQLHIDGNPAVRNGKDFEVRLTWNIQRLYALLIRMYSNAFNERINKESVRKLLFDGEILKEPGSYMFYNMFDTNKEVTNPQKQTGCNNNTCSHKR